LNTIHQDLLAGVLVGAVLVAEVRDAIPADPGKTPVFPGATAAVWAAIEKADASGLEPTLGTIQAYLAPGTDLAPYRYGPQSSAFAALPAVVADWQKRAALDALFAASTAIHGAEDPEQAVACAAALLAGLGDGGRRGARTIEQLCDDGEAAFVAACARRDGDQVVQGLPYFGVQYFDSALCGLRPGQLVVVAAGTSVGKTALMLSAIWNMIRAEAPALFFSLEMPGEEIWARLASFATGISAAAIITGNVVGEHRESVKSARWRLDTAPLWIDDRGGVTAAQVCARVKAHCARYGVPELVVIDHLNELAKHMPKDSREENLADGCRMLKALAKDIGAPILTGCQVNEKEQRGRKDTKPIISDMKGANAIAEVADVLIALWRAGTEPDADRHGSIQKHRGGPTRGWGKLPWRAKTMQFEA
jgi:replicative DNA helicase